MMFDGFIPIKEQFGCCQTCVIFIIKWFIHSIMPWTSSAIVRMGMILDVFCLVFTIYFDGRFAKQIWINVTQFLLKQWTVRACNILVVILPGHFSTVKVIPLKMMVNQFWDVISIFEWCNWQCFVCHLNIVWLGLSFVWPFKYRMFHTYILQSFIKLLFLWHLCWAFCKIYLIMFTRTGIPSLWTSNSACLWKCEACHEIFAIPNHWVCHGMYILKQNSYLETSVIKKTHTVLDEKELSFLLLIIGCLWNMVLFLHGLGTVLSRL